MTYAKTCPTQTTSSIVLLVRIQHVARRLAVLVGLAGCLAARQVVAASRIFAKLAGRSFAQHAQPCVGNAGLRLMAYGDERVTIALPARSCVLKSRLAAFVGTASGRTAGFIGAAASVQADLVWWSCMRPQLTCNLGPAKQLSAQKDPRKKQALSCVFEPGLLTCVGHASWLAACRIVAAVSIRAHLARWSFARFCQSR